MSEGMMKREITLPTSAIDILAGRHEAAAVAEKLSVAYWLHGRADDTALFMIHKAHEEFVKLAEALGYNVALKPVEKPEHMRVAS